MSRIGQLDLIIGKSSNVRRAVTHMSEEEVPEMVGLSSHPGAVSTYVVDMLPHLRKHQQ